MILVTGSTGNVGQHVVRELMAINVPFRALAHTSAKAKALEAQGIEAVVGDFADGTSIRTALQGIERVFLLLPDSPRRVQLEKDFLTEARRAAVRHVVKLSILGANSQAAAPILKWHGQSEQQLEASSLAYTHLRVNWFMQDMLADQARSIAQESTIYQPHEEAHVSLLDTRDVGAVAAKVLTETGHEGRAYEITGPEALSFSQIAEKLSAYLGKPVVYSRISDAMAWQNMLANGVPAHTAHNYLTLFQFHRQGGGAVLTGFIEILTGRPARTLDGFIAENIQGFK
ncbi:MAG: NAD(P)-dependent oxidoreductase [Anaerolineaceae bacterium]|nr:NAD(P)-dependent oxidoreductase [Anaerolineaceae bacterium]